MNALSKKVIMRILTVLLWISGILFIWTFKNGVCYGDKVLQFLNVKSWSNGTSGTHYTPFYSLLFFIPALFVGKLFK